MKPNGKDTDIRITELFEDVMEMVFSIKHVRNEIRSLCNQDREHLNRVIAQGLRGYQHTVHYPANGSFELSKPMFNTRGDILHSLRYRGYVLFG